MNYQITSDNIEMTPSMEVLAKEKLARIEHRFKDISSEDVDVRVVINSAPGEKFSVKVNILAKGHKYFSDETDYTVESALIRTVDELFRMMEKEKHDHKLKEEVKAEDLMAES